MITSTPGLIRSSQPVMCFGFPFRTTNTTTESLEKPCSGFAFQVLDTIPSLTRRVMSGVVENATASAGWPVSTARLCEPDAPNDWPNETPLPALVCANAVVSASYAFFGVEYATSWSLVLPAPLVAAALLADPPLVLVESEEPPQPASTAARLIATIAVVRAAASVRRDRDLIEIPLDGGLFSGSGRRPGNPDGGSAYLSYLIEITRFIGLLTLDPIGPPPTERQNVRKLRRRRITAFRRRLRYPRAPRCASSSTSRERSSPRPGSR